MFVLVVPRVPPYVALTFLMALSTKLQSTRVMRFFGMECLVSFSRPGRGLHQLTPSARPSRRSDTAAGLCPTRPTPPGEKNDRCSMWVK
jgi:hypothetical protein